MDAEEEVEGGESGGRWSRRTKCYMLGRVVVVKGIAVVLEVVVVTVIVVTAMVSGGGKNGEDCGGWC